MKISEWLDKGFNLFKSNLAILVVGTLLTMLIAGFTMGILAGPMYAGMVLIVLRLLRGDTAEFGDVFKGFEYFLQAFLLTLVAGAVMVGISFVLNAIVCVGSILNIAVSVLFQSFVMLAMFFIVDKKMDFWPACMKVFELIKGNPGPVLAFLAVAGCVALVGMVACVVGVFFTWPLSLCMLAVAYDELFRPEADIIDVEAEAVQETPAAEESDAESGNSEDEEKPAE